MQLPQFARYAWAVLVRAKLYLGGGSAVMVILGLYQGISGNTVAPIVYVLCASITVIAAIFVHGLEQYRELEPRLVIGDPDYYTHTAPRLTHCYRIPIGNRGRAKTIKNVTVQLIDIQPKPQVYTWGKSMPLHWKDDNVPPCPRARDIKAGSPEEVDFVQAMQNEGVIVVNHIADKIAQTLSLPITNYRLTIEAKGDDVPSAKAKFEVWMDHGKLQCVALGSY
jgi:hypothetical protein